MKKEGNLLRSADGSKCVDLDQMVGHRHLTQADLDPPTVSKKVSGHGAGLHDRRHVPDPQDHRDGAIGPIHDN